MAALIKRRIEVVAFERQRIISKPLQMLCPLCHTSSEFLTARQAGVLAQVTPKSIYRWLASGKAHGLKTAGGGQRICRQSLFRPLSGFNDRPATYEQLQLSLGE
jgi:hypothetical protein